MSCAKDARKLANYINSINDSFQKIPAPDQFSYTHIGALYTDIVLQAGLNYNSVVKPRVQRVLLNYADGYTISKFQELIAKEGLEMIIMWKHPEKLNRMIRLINYSVENDINSCCDLKIHLTEKANRDKLLELNGVGPKTLDYLLKLLKFDTVAVDRHIYSFVEMANIKASDYYHTKKVVEYAADFLEVSRACIDYSIWKYMSDKKVQKEEGHLQLKMEFF
jgi:hypothetical protein